MKFIFWCGLPRAGNTAIGSIINSNKNITMTAYSILPHLIHQLISNKNINTFINFPDHDSYDNILRNLFNNYYQNWKSEYIIERGWWGTDLNLRYLENVFNNIKFVILWRPVIQVINSFVKINKNNFLKNDDDIRNYVKVLMEPNGGIGLPLHSILNLIKKNKNYKIFYYKDFIDNKAVFFKNLSDYLQFNIKIPDKLRQFSINGLKYNDESINQRGLHTVSENLQFNNKYENVLPKDIIEKYKNFYNEPF